VLCRPMRGCPVLHRFGTVLPWGKIMAVSKELLEILVCPICKTPVKLTADSTGLKCATCCRVYPVRDDIPVMLVDEARIEPS
jgi:uncharacterized protein